MKKQAIDNVLQKTAKQFQDQQFDPENAGVNNDEILSYHKNRQPLLEGTDSMSGIELFSSSLKKEVGNSKRIHENLSSPKYSGKVVSKKDIFQEEENDLNELDDLHDIAHDKMIKEDLAEVTKQIEREGQEDEAEDDEARMEVEQTYADALTDENDIVLNLKSQVQKEQQRGKSVFDQKLLYDNLLKYRILLQKPLQMANQLPQRKSLDQFLSVCDEMNIDLREPLTEIKTSIKDSIVDLVEIQNHFLSKVSSFSEHPTEITNSTSSEQVKQSFEEDANLNSIWKQIDNNYLILKSFRNTALDNWNERTRFQQGLNLKGGINISFSKKIENMLQNRTELVKKVNTKKFEEKILGKRKRNEEETEEAEVDTEIYDDRDFYQKLLRDLIEDVGASALEKGTSIANGLQNKTNTKKKPKTKSKGRQIQYAVHTKLVSFMAPREQPVPDTADKLFKSLFGATK